MRLANFTMCSHCGEELSPSGDQPCPYCGKMGRTICASLRDGISVRDDQAVGLTDGKTGRSAIHSDTRNPTETILIQSHIQTFVAGEPAEMGTSIDNLVAAFSSVLSGDYGTFYRGLDAASRYKIKGGRIGPALKPSDGRYNTRSEKYIYLIDDPAFLSFEIGASKVLVQEYKIPLSKTRIADLSVNNTEVENSLSLILQMTERGKTSSGFEFENHLQQKGLSRYLLSQSVARVFKQRGWQGMYVPGVHGKPGNTYRNLALFGTCVNDWKKWAIGNYYEYSGRAESR